MNKKAKPSKELKSCCAAIERTAQLETRQKVLKENLLSPKEYERVTSLVACHINSLQVKKAASKEYRIEHWDDEINYYSNALNGLRRQATKAIRIDPFSLKEGQ